MSARQHERRVTRTLELINDSDQISEHNRTLIKEYHRDRSLQGLSPATHQKNLSYLKKLAEHVGNQPFDDMTTADIKDLIEWIQHRDLADGTINTYKEITRLFWTWLHRDDLNGEDYPACVAWITTDGYTTTKLPQDLLTNEDIEAQLAAANNYRDKALIAILYETGARIGELIDLTVGDIEDRENGRKVVIDGKTGSRRLPLRQSVPYLNRWLADHPNPEATAPLWCKIQQGTPPDTLDPTTVDDLRDIHGIGPSYAAKLNNAGITTGQGLLDQSVDELAAITGVTATTAAGWRDQFDPTQDPEPDVQLGYRYIRDKILARTMEDAGIDKPSNPHHYRHSRASYLANQLTEAQLCEWFGWVQGSTVPAKYVHLSGRDLDDAYDAMFGDTDPEDAEVESPADECDRCGQLNETNATYCGNCGFNLVEDTDLSEDYLSKDEALELVAAAVHVTRTRSPAPDGDDDIRQTIEDTAALVHADDGFKGTPVHELLPDPKSHQQ